MIDNQKIYSKIRKLVEWLMRQSTRSERKRLYTMLAHIAKRYEERGGAVPQEVSRAHAERSSQEQVYDLIETASIVVQELHLDDDSLLALLLLRPVMDGVIAERDVEQQGWVEAMRLVGLLRRTSALFLRQESISSEHFHNLLLSMAEDIRVVLLIIADRLYRLRHAQELYRPQGALALAMEVSQVYAPIAHRLGLYTIKGEMEDLSLKWRDRKSFDFVVRKLGETKEHREAYIQAFITPVRKRLEQELDVAYEIKGRTKSISSIHNKLRKQVFEDIYDLFAIRIIVDAPLERERQVCWQVYSIVTDMFRPNPQRLKDWISIPKSNGYESLHTTVMGPEQRWVEVQIRTQRMDAIAEQGVAAHWLYKGIKKEGGGLDEFLASVRDTLEQVRDHQDEDKRTLLETSMMTLKAPEIYVFTPQGEVKKLPRGATVLDFAFSIHTRVGAQAMSGKVNGKNVSLRHQLVNGDSVEVITNPQQSPKQDWLSIVVSTSARARIRQILRAEEEAGLDMAKELVQRRLKNRKIPYNESLFSRLVIKRGYKALSDFYRDIAHDKLDAQAFIDHYEQELTKQEQIASEAPQVRSVQEYVPTFGTSELDMATELAHDDVLVIDRGLTGVAYSFAKCCQPVYGDPIFGFVSARGIKIHRTDCPNAPDMLERGGHRVIVARWSGNDASAQQIQIGVVGRDDIAVVTHVISLIKKERDCQLRSYHIDSGDGVFRGHFELYVGVGVSITNLIKKIRGAVGIKHVDRH